MKKEVSQYLAEKVHLPENLVNRVRLNFDSEVVIKAIVNNSDFKFVESQLKEMGLTVPVVKKRFTKALTEMFNETTLDNFVQKLDEDYIDGRKLTTGDLPF